MLYPSVDSAFLFPISYYLYSEDVVLGVSESWSAMNGLLTVGLHWHYEE